MPHIVLTDEQIQALHATNEAIEARDAEGKLVTFLQPLHPVEVKAILKLRERRAGGASETGLPSARVGALLRKAHEIDEREGMTPEKMQELLRRARAGEEL